MVFKPKKKTSKTLRSKPDIEEELEEEEEDDSDEPDEEELEDDEEEEVEEEIEEPKIKKKIIQEKIWSIQEVPTETTQIIYNSKEKKSYNLASAIVELLNKIDM